ncbi:Vacuolar protein sorting-associated protein 52 [Orobanche gracilis]
MMTEVVTNYGRRHVLDLGAFVGELSVEDDEGSDAISLEGLEQELQDCKTDDVVSMILSKGTKLRDYTKDVENNLRQIELDSIEDYIKESDNLVSLHDEIHDCDTILSQMEKLLSGFQVEIGSISSDIKVLQEKSLDMGLKLKNRKAAESKLAKFVEDIIVPPRMIDIIVDGELNEEYMRTLEILSKKLKFVEADSMVKTSTALNDVQPELEKLRQKAVSKGRRTLWTESAEGAPSKACASSKRQMPFMLPAGRRTPRCVSREKRSETRFKARGAPPFQTLLMRGVLAKYNRQQSLSQAGDTELMVYTI